MKQQLNCLFSSSSPSSSSTNTTTNHTRSTFFTFLLLFSFILDSSLGFTLSASSSASPSSSLLFLHSRRHILQTMASSSTIITESNNINNINNNHGFDETKYWNREVSHKKEFTQPIIKNANIICLSDANDVANAQLYNNNNNNSLLLGLPQGSKVLAIGTSIQDFDLTILKQEKPNVIFISNPKALDALDQMLIELPSIEWIHVRSAGIDYISSSATLTSLSSSSNGNNIVVTNAKGTFSSTLAEYTMMAIAYFAKDLPRLLKQKNDSTWDKYCVEEIRGKTLGIIGYGDIGRACAKLASAYGMYDLYGELW